MPSPPPPLLARRLVALGIDGAVIGGYVAVLFATTMALYQTTSGGVPDLLRPSAWREPTASRSPR